MRAMSKKRRSQLVERAAVRSTVLARDVVCQAQRLVPELMCVGPLDVHEIIPRSAWPQAWLTPEACILICRNHHQWVDNHPAQARALGLHGSSWDRPDGHCGLGAP